MDAANVVQNAIEAVERARSRFSYARCDQGKKLRKIEGDSVLDIKTILKQGKLYIIPHRDLRMETPLLLEEERALRENVEDVVVRPHSTIHSTSTVAPSPSVPTISTVSSSPSIPTTSTVSPSPSVPTTSTVSPSPSVPTTSTVAPSPSVPTTTTAISTLATVSELVSEPDVVDVNDFTHAQNNTAHDSSFEETDTPVISFRRRRAASIRARATIRENAAAIMMTSGSSSLVSSPVSQANSPLRLDIDSPPRVPPLPSLENSPQVLQQSDLDSGKVQYMMYLFIIPAQRLVKEI